MAGKTDVPTYVSKTSRIESDGTNMKIKQFDSDPVVIMNQAANKVTMSLTVKSYVPIGVYKCLTKMALSIMPDDEARHFDRRASGFSPRIRLTRSAASPATSLTSSSSRDRSHLNTHGPALLRRRNDSFLLPHIIFVIASANLILQSFSPLSDKDDFLHDRKFKFPRFGLPTGPGSMFGASTVGQTPLDLPKKVRNSSVMIEHHVDSFHWKA